MDYGYITRLECEVGELVAELATLRADNEMLRDALREIAGDDWNNADWVRNFAKEALK